MIFRYVGDFCNKSVTSISNLSSNFQTLPKKFVSNIRHQHRCYHCHVWMPPIQIDKRFLLLRIFNSHEFQNQVFPYLKNAILKGSNSFLDYSRPFSNGIWKQYITNFTDKVVLNEGVLNQYDNQFVWYTIYNILYNDF